MKDDVIIEKIKKGDNKAVDYLYFVASGNDKHQFSNNLQEQNKAVRKLRRYQKNRLKN